MLHIDKLKQLTDGAKNLLVSLEAYRESAQEAVSRFRDWLSSQSRDELLTVLISDLEELGEAEVACVSYGAYDDAISGVSDKVEVLLHTGERIKVEASKVITAIEGQITDLRLQSNFLDYIMETAELNRDSFISQASALLSSVSASMLEIYGSFISGASDPIEAFQAFLKYGTVGAKVDDTFITVSDSSQYGGNVLASVLTQIGEDFVKLFELTSEKVGQFLFFGFRSIEMLWSAVKWIGKRLFAEQLSAFEILTSHRGGLLDFPFGQWRIPVQDGRVWNGLLGSFQSYLTYGSLYSRFLSDGRVTYDHLASFGSSSANAPQIYQSLRDALLNGLKESDGNGGFVTTIREIPLPSTYPANNVQFVLRIGRTSTDGDLILQIFPVISRGFINRNTTDLSISRILAKSYGGVIEALSEVLPFTPTDPSSLVYTADEFRDTVFLPTINDHVSLNKLLDDSEATFLTRGLPYYLPEKDISVTREWAQNNPDRARFLVSLLVFAAAYGFSSKYEVTTSAWELLYKVDKDGSNGLTADQATAAAQTFRPFSKLPTSVAVHYQNTEEYASDWVKLLRIGAIVAVTVVVAVKTFKAVKSWKIKTQLAEAAMDAASWDVAGAIGTAGYEAAYSTFMKARKKYMYMHVINIAAGLIPVGLGAVKNGLSAVSDRLTSAQADRLLGKDPASPLENDIDLSSIYRKIVGQ
jgi:hypothetical protein